MSGSTQHDYRLPRFQLGNYIVNWWDYVLYYQYLVFPKIDPRWRVDHVLIRWPCMQADVFRLNRLARGAKGVGTSTHIAQDEKHRCQKFIVSCRFALTFGRRKAERCPFHANLYYSFQTVCNALSTLSTALKSMITLSNPPILFQTPL